MEDLRRALGVKEWNLMTSSSSSRIALEVMDRYPDHVRSATLDSPEFAGDGGFGSSGRRYPGGSGGASSLL